ncbi:hypothetical protein FB567DRAFT_531325 [Paraphoma chrysanthemicola]|uniref:Uncharacterized protein n=1 Tax=Paraphoma chrysanthemicola TaxID=798071 RepID=A0A8K0R1W8_9PLEO|nr:hypothetical protein FB567DRAFT_531325 [Paraphoma chrysanthemicola]
MRCTSILILSTPLSYMPVVNGILALRSTNGISIMAALLLALSAQSQIATMYYLWACPPFKRDGEVVPKPPLSTDYLNLVQLLVQWTCALLFLAFLLVTRTHEQAASLNPSISAAMTTDGDDHASPSKKTAITLLVVHASLCIFWAILAGQPRDDWLDLQFVTIMGINQYCINPIITITTAIAFALQFEMAQASQGRSALNSTTMLPHIVVFSALAISWPFRFKVPLNLRSEGSMWLMTEWYPLVGWTCVNTAISAIGQAAVLYAVLRGLTGRARLGSEREALLTT